jgi:hypothetical protein
MINFFYETYYEIIKNFIYDTNDTNNLFIIKNDFNIFTDFNYIIKKNNIKISILINDDKIYNKLLYYKKGEELDEHITIYNKIEDIKDIFFDKIIIFHLSSIIELKDTLEYLNNILKIDSLIYLYCSLIKETNELKNSFRNNIMKYTNYQMGNILLYENVLNCINDNKKYKINSIQIYKKNYYIFYGNNTVYKIVLKKQFNEFDGIII